MRGKATPRPETAREGKDCKDETPGFGFRAGLARVRGAGMVRGRRDRRAVTVTLWAVVLPLLVLADCDEDVPFWPDGILPPRANVADSSIGWPLPVVVALVAAGVLLAAGAAVVAWSRHRPRGRHRPGGLGRLLAGGVLGVGS
jgi:hypothetical protein